MVRVTITEKGDKLTTREFEQIELTIGRVQGNDIVLPKSNISKRHARIVYNDGNWVLIDANSTNGTYVNGKRLSGPHDLRHGDKIFIGDYTLELLPQLQEAPKEDPVQSPRQVVPRQAQTRELEANERPPVVEQPPEVPSFKPAADLEDAALLPEDIKLPARPKSLEETAVPKRDPAKSKQRSAVLRLVHQRLRQILKQNQDKLLAQEDENSQQAFIGQSVHDIVRAMHKNQELPSDMDVGLLTDTLLAEVLGMGPLTDLLNDASVSEILVNGAHQIYVEREGKLEPTAENFSSNEALFGLIERIVWPLGRHIDVDSPMVDARLPDGSRVNAVIPPLSLNGPLLTIRKFKSTPLQIDDLVAGGSLSADMAEFLEICVQARKNIIISGGTGSGKTTLLNVVSGFIDSHERIVTIEDSAELQLEQKHVVSLESRQPDINGQHEISIRKLVLNALRMRPDRIVVGECRGGEAFDMLQAMSTGHDGSLTTIHANSPRHVPKRLKDMVLMSGIELPVKAIYEQITGAIHIIVQQERSADGKRRVTHISEIVGMEGDVVSMHDLFVFEQKSIDSKGQIIGQFRATGVVPKFYEKLRATGLSPNLAIFRQI